MAEPNANPNAPLAVSDIVRLLSGGPEMTLEGFSAPAPSEIATHKGFATEKMARCVWMDRDGHVQERMFWPHLLTGASRASGEVKPDSDRRPTAFPIGEFAKKDWTEAAKEEAKVV